MTDPESPLDELRRLQGVIVWDERLDPEERPEETEVAFYNAAFEALGPDGCVTRELKRLQQHVKAAEKENRVLLARLVKFEAASRKLLEVPMPSDDKDANYTRLIDRRLALRGVLNEVPPP